ncbi:MAG TPA: sigma-70 family RNA polymerase sigma factor [Solirubrobacteraceae bacterium]|jgi:RNA polymerase sigma factor (sigma-70 family)
MQPGARDLVVSVVSEHAESLLRVARRYTACAADAEDAYQRALEVFVKNAHRLDAGGAHKWLHVVVRHEALAVRRARSSLVGVEDESTLDALDDARHVASVEERSERFDELSRAAEALQRLKPQEVTALWLKAEGLSYDEIAERQGWTYTKVNRCITEGRRAFLRRYAGIEAGEECERWTPTLSAIADGEATPEQVLEARPHLRNCPSCRTSLAEMHRAGTAVAALLPPVGAVLGEGDLPGMLGRVGDVVASVGASVQERAAAAALKAQAAADAIVSGKLAAVAASAAALAGGGIPVEHELGDDSARADAGSPVAAVQPASAPVAAAAPASVSAVPDPSGRERPGAVAAASAINEARAQRDKGDDEREAPADAAFAPEVPAAASPPEPGAARAPEARASTRPPAPPAPAERDGEFGFVPAPPRHAP